MSLGNWGEPLTWIVNYLVPPESRKKTLSCAELFKSLHDKSGVTISNLDAIAEVCKNVDNSHFATAAKCLGFRGDYDIVSEASQLKQEYDLCLIPKNLKSKQKGSIVAKHILKK